MYYKQIKYNHVIFVDAVNGNLNFALQSDFNYPFQDIFNAASSASSLYVSSGQRVLVWIRPGSYTNFNNILFDGVDFYADKEVSITSFVTMFNADTTAGGTTLTSKVQFLGHASISSSQPVCVIRTNPSAVIDLYASPYTCTNNSNGMVIRDGIFNLYNNGDYVSAGRNFNVRDTGNINCTILGKARCTFGNNFNGVFYSTGGMNWSGTANIIAEAFEVPTPSASMPVIHLSNAQNCNLNITLQYYTDTSGNTYPFIECIDGTTIGSNINISIGEINSPTRPLYSVSDADHSVFIDIKRGILKGGTCTAGTVKLSNYQGTSNTTFSLGGGTVIVQDCNINTSASAGVIPVTITTGTLSTFSSFYTTDGAAVPINNVGGTFISQASASTVFPSGIVTGNFYVSGVRYENTQSHTAGATVTINNNVTLLYVDPAALLANLDITMPSAPVNNQEVTVVFGGTIVSAAVVTNLTWTPGAGQSIIGTPITSASGGTFAKYKYQASTAYWRPV